MTYSRRQAIGLGTAALAGAGLSQSIPLAAFGQNAMMPDGDTLATGAGDVTIHPVMHASLVLGFGETVIYVDPVGEPALYADFPPPTLVLVTHEHGDHFSADTLGAIVGEAPLITNPAVHGMLAGDLQSGATAIGNGEAITAAEVPIAAIPAYNTTEDRLQYHPEGRDNGYILTLGDRRIYIAGDTEDIPEMRALTDIALAFVPMNLPFTMDIGQAASAVIEFAPGIVYPYHYRGSDTEAFKAMVDEAGGPTEVRLHDWYAQA